VDGPQHKHIPEAAVATGASPSLCPFFFQPIRSFENGGILPQSYHRRLIGPIDLVQGIVVGIVAPTLQNTGGHSAQSGVESIKRQHSSSGPCIISLMCPTMTLSPGC
jgi:hypothetical protein